MFLRTKIICHHSKKMVTNVIEDFVRAGMTAIVQYIIGAYY